jgi:hypothetical protein
LSCEPGIWIFSAGFGVWNSNFEVKNPETGVGNFKAEVENRKTGVNNLSIGENNSGKGVFYINTLWRKPNYKEAGQGKR